MTTYDTDLVGRTAVDSNGEKIGKIAQVYLDDQTDQPSWVTISTGLFGTKESFAPLTGYSASGDDVMLAVTKEAVKGAPSVESDGHVEQSEEAALYEYYGLGDQYAAGNAGRGQVDRDARLSDAAQGQGHDTSGPNTDTAITRSEEQLRVGTEQVEAGRARLRKHVVTENVTTTVPVSHEEVRIEREPITDANRGAAMSGADITEEEHEVTLHAERPVVTTEAVPVERVRLATETVTEDETVSGTVRKEKIDQVDTDGDVTTDTR
ncbi:MAG: uncharacterized protein JWN61_2146 [Pseudonocardiales bacterium]|nr:uncharacterized protein [Pseudonocardiales bacterium]